MTDVRDGRSPEQSRDPLVGTTLDSRYELLRRLGRGGMSTVYQARHLLLHKLVAVKVLKEELAHDQRVIEMIFREARTVASLGHPAIVNALDVGVTSEGLAYIVLELLEGTSLGHEIARCGRIDAGRAVRIVTQVASAMEAAHGAGVVHRDLKPENIFLLASGARADVADACKVLDFGVAKQTLSAMHGATLTSYGGVVGTPGYMAPEQLLTPDRVDHRVDVYALGVVLFEMLAGQPPYHDIHTLPELVARVQSGHPPRIVDAAPGVPSALAEVVDMAMAHAPDDRFQTMADFGRSLRSFAVETGAFADSPWLLMGGVTPPPVYAPNHVSFGGPRYEDAPPNPHGVTPATMPAILPLRSSSNPARAFEAGHTPNPPRLVVASSLPLHPSAPFDQTQAMVSPHRAPSLPGLSVGEGATSPSPLATSGSPVAPAAPAPTSPLLVSQNPLAAPPPEPGAARSRTPILVGGGLLVLVAAGLIARSLGPAAEVELSVSSSAGDAVATVRGQQYPLPSKIRVKRQSDPEMVEVRARGFDERRFWVTVDHDLTLLAELNRSAPPAALPAVPPTGSAAAPVAPVPPSPTAPTAAPAAPAAAPPAAAPAVAAVAAPARPAPSEPAPRSAASTSVVPRGAPGPAAPGRPAVATPAAPSGPTAAPAAEPRPAAAHNEPVPSPSPAPIAAAPAPAPAPPPVVAAPPAAPAPSPVPVPAAPAVVPLAAAAFSQQLSAHRAAVDACIAEDPSVSGRMTVRVAVRRDGSVESAAAESGATPAVRACVVKQVRTWRFPAGEARAEGRFPIELD